MKNVSLNTEGLAKLQAIENWILRHMALIISSIASSVQNKQYTGGHARNPTMNWRNQVL